MTTDDLIDLAGDVPRLALIAGVARTTPYDWKASGFIPGMRVSKIASGLGLQIADVQALVRPPKTRRGRSYA